MTRKVITAAVLLVLAFAGTAHAVTYTVTGTADGDPIADPCASTSCPSLRAAIHQVNVKSTGSDVINVPPGRYTLSNPAATSGSPDDTTGDLNIEKPVTINGSGAGSTVIDGNGVDRVFEVDSSTGNGGVVFSGLTITGGSNAPGNTTSFSEGGAIAIPGDDPVTIQNSVLTGNTTSSNGGGISYEAGGTTSSLTIENSAISGNHAPAQTGGGIFMDAFDRTVTITGSTISGNDARDDGGLLAHAITTITNSTISGNTATRSIGGLEADFATTTLLNDTIASNSAGGIYNNGAAIDVKNTIVASNGGSDCVSGGQPTSQGHNIASDSSCTSFTAGGDRQSTDPQLGPLQDNGGPTPTHALPQTSPAVDSGDNNGCPATDQRGLARPFDGNFDGIAVCDIGAFERNSPPAAVAPPPGGTTIVLPAQPGPPVEGVSANLIPISGTVLVAQRLSGKARASAAATKGAMPGFGPFVKLTSPAQVQIGTLINTNKGVVQLLTAVNHAGATQSGQFSRGLFVVQQSKANPLTTASMAGGNLNSCSKLPHGGAAKQVVAARRSRSLFANVHGRFRTRGRNSTATVRGTAFLVKDTCSGTLTSVSRGVVTVRDFNLRKTVKVKAHHKYLARARKKR